VVSAFFDWLLAGSGYKKPPSSNWFPRRGSVRHFNVVGNGRHIDQRLVPTGIVEADPSNDACGASACCTSVIGELNFIGERISVEKELCFAQALMSGSNPASLQQSTWLPDPPSPRVLVRHTGRLDMISPKGKPSREHPHAATIAAADEAIACLIS